MEESYSDLKSFLLQTHEMHSLSIKFLTRHGGYIDYAWWICQSTVNFFYASQLAPRLLTKEAEFFVTLDYITYIPFGKSGYDEFEKILNKNGKTVAQYRFDKFKQIMGDGYSTLTAEQENAIQNFFENYNATVVDLESVHDVVSLICRIYHSYEASFDTATTSMNKIDDTIRPAIEELGRKYYRKEKVNANDYIPQNAQTLDEKDIEYLLKIVGYVET